MDRLSKIREVAGIAAGDKEQFSPAEGGDSARVTFADNIQEIEPLDDAMKLTLEINKETAETLDAFYLDVNKVKSNFDAIEELTKTLQSKHQENIQNVDTGKAKEIRQEIDDLSFQINDKASQSKNILDEINKKTAALKETPESSAANPAVIRIQENQYNYLVFRFTTVMGEYGRQQTVNENFYKAQTQRQIKIKCTNPDGSTIDDAQAAQLAEQVLESQTSLEDNYIFQQSRSVLANVLETRADIYRIEASMRTLNQLFNDLAFLVHEQGELIDVVLHNVQQATSYVEKGRKELKKARKYQKKSKKKMFCIICCVIVIIVLIVIAGILGGVLPTR